jgi:chromosome segregation ATPase
VSPPAEPGVCHVNQRLDQTRAELSERLDQTRAELSERLDQTNERLDETHQRLEHLEQRIVFVEKAVGDVRGEIRTLNDHFEHHLLGPERNLLFDLKLRVEKLEQRG